MAEPSVHRTSRLAVLHDDSLGRDFDPAWFDRAHWQEHGASIHSTKERGSVLMLERDGETWVLRHYHRGGFVARFVYDRYLWLGWERTRSFREWRLLHRLHDAGLPVPKPVAARATRRGPAYRADIVTVYLPDTRPLSACLSDGGGPGARRWRAIGEMVRRFHDFGVDHPDLTAHNILLDTSGAVFLVDFDNAFIKPSGAWKQAGMARLQRSLRKVAAESGRSFDEEAWRVLEQGYGGQG